MRCLLVIVFGLFILASPGCMALDEIDKASAKLHGGGKKKAAEVSETAGAQETPPNPLLEQSRQWWESATSLAPKNVNPAIVSCRVDGGTQFTSRDRCLLIGGKPSGVSG
jgi:hypothetical protein